MRIQITDELSQEIKDITFAAGGGANSQLVKTILLLAHPIGSYYWSSTNTNPHDLFGGTWVQVKDKFVIAVGDNHEVGKNYGSNIKNLSHNHTTGNHTLTISEIPSHNHNYEAYIINPNAEWPGGYDKVLTYGQPAGTASFTPATYPTGGSGAHNHGNTGSSLSTTFDITPACEAAYCWKRTA